MQEIQALKQRDAEQQDEADFAEGAAENSTNQAQEAAPSTRGLS